jgi:glycosyltransferase involved in cell wall biosynthesis
VVLFLLPHLSGGGAERVTLNLLIELHSRGHLVGIIVFDKNGPLLSMLPGDIPIYDLGTNSLKYSIFLLIKKLQQLNPEVIFSTLGYINVALLAIRWFLPRGTEIWIREANLPSISLPNNSYPKLMTFLYKLLYRKADRLICTSIRMRDEFISDLLIPKKIIDILPNPVDVDSILAAAFPIKRFDKGGVCYIAAGRLTFQKGFDRLILWFSEIENKKSTLVILGDGDLKDELVKYADSLNLCNRIKFVGFCKNPWQWYAGADAFLLASRWEGMPNVVLESLACGTQVIATKESGGIGEIMGQSKCDGIIVVNNAEQFVKEMNRVKVIGKDSKESLLPERYKKDNVVSIVENWLNIRKEVCK